MAEDSPDTEPEEDPDQAHHGGERALPEGCSRFSRSRIDSSIEEFLNNKEAKRLEGTKAIPPKRTGLSRKPLNPVSKKGRKKKQEYAKATAEHYKNDENRRCALCGTNKNLSIHHSEKRDNGNHAKEETCITLCILGSYMDQQFPEMNHSHSGGCHGFVEGNKAWARDNGYLK